MTTHLSTRLVWHDRAWDGHICDHPDKNAYCIVQQHIRDGRDDERETKAAGLPLSKLGISYEYEQKLPSKNNPNDFRLPDFTVSYEGDTFYWEHLGMLSVPSYKEAWDKKRQWYEDNGFLGRVITSEEGPDGSIDATAIERIARKKILLED